MAPFLYYTILLAASAATSSGSTIPSQVPPQNVSSVQWLPCTNLGVDNNPQLQCANLSVPIDWDAPNSSTMNLGIVKLPTNGTNRIGNLFVNPGGPGGLASTMVARMASGTAYIASQVREGFDIIGIDPRGFGISQPIQCDIDIWNERVSLFPADEASFQKMVDSNRRLGQSCLEMTGPLLEHVDTISVVKDLEAVRIALGDELLTWLGYSYGTLIGAQYAARFPNKIRAIVNDGNVLHSQDEAAILLTETTTYERVLEHFLTWASNDIGSPLHGQDATSLWTSLITNATDDPIPALGCGDQCRKDVSDEDILFNVQNLLVKKSTGWPLLAQALLEASNGNATLFSQYGTWTPTQNPGLFAGVAVLCLDWNHNATALADVQAKKNQGLAFAPLAKGASQTWTSQTRCIGWPGQVVNPPIAERINTSAPILLVNSFYDPETSYAWAVDVRDEMRKTANVTLLSRNGDGHTSYGLEGETTAAMNDFLVNLTLPADGTVFNS